MLVLLVLFFFFKQKTAYDMRISDWSSDVCSSDLLRALTRLCLPKSSGTTNSCISFLCWSSKLSGCSFNKAAVSKLLVNKFVCSQGACPAPYKGKRLK